MKNEKSVYKIKNLNTGKFSTGGYCPKWSSKGKTWSALGYLKRHLSNINTKNIYENCRIVKFQLVMTEISSGKKITELIEEMAKEKKIKDLKFAEDCKRLKVKRLELKKAKDDMINSHVHKRNDPNNFNNKYPIGFDHA